MCAAPFGDLNREAADRPRTAVDQHTLSGDDPAPFDQALPSGEGRDRGNGRRVVADVARLRGDPADRSAAELGLPAAGEPVVLPEPEVALGEAGRADTEGRHLTR